jgi:hypothetical protein
MNQPGNSQEYRSAVALVSDGDDTGSDGEIYAGADLFAAAPAGPDEALPGEVEPGIRRTRETRVFGKHHGTSDWFFFSKH